LGANQLTVALRQVPLLHQGDEGREVTRQLFRLVVFAFILDGARESSVGIANRRRDGKPRNRGSISGRVKRISSSPSRL